MNIKSKPVTTPIPIVRQVRDGINAAIGQSARVGSDLNADRYRVSERTVSEKPILLNRSKYLRTLLGAWLSLGVGGNVAHAANSLKAAPVFELIAVADVTAYSWHDDNIDWGSFERTIHEGSIAISRDLESLGLVRGTLVYVEGLGVYTVKDRTGKKWTRRIDIYVHDKKEARKFGIKKEIRIFKIILPKGANWK